MKRFGKFIGFVFVLNTILLGDSVDFFASVKKQDLVDVQKRVDAKEVEIDVQDSYGNTALMFAASAGNVAMFEYLLSHGASLELKNKVGWTPLDIATKKNRTQIISIILNKPYIAKGMSVEDATSWQKIGVSPENALVWMEAKVSAEEAGAFLAQNPNGGVEEYKQSKANPIAPPKEEVVVSSTNATTTTTPAPQPQLTTKSTEWDGRFYQGKTSYTPHNATVYDNYTHLVWQNNDETTTTVRTYDAAKRYCENLVLEGQKDWRLPTIKELESLIDFRRYYPAMDGVFVSKPDYYWSSTLDVNHPKSGWLVYFYDGSLSSYPLTSTNYLRCVRKGK